MAETSVPTPPKKPARGRRRLVVWGVVSVVALAGIIFAVSALSSPKRVPELPRVSVAAAESRRDYERALDALAAGDTTKAAQLLERAVERDPGNVAAKKRLKDIKSAPLPKNEQPKPSNPGTGTAPPPPDDSAFDKAVADVGTLLPVAVPGFEPGEKTVEGADAELPLDPDDRSLAARVTRVQLSVHDRGTREAAETYVKDHSSRLYARNASTIDVDGVQAKSGTNDARLAAVIFSRGRFAFEVVVTSTGADPAQVLDVALAVAKTFPDTR